MDKYQYYYQTKSVKCVRARACVCKGKNEMKFPEKKHNRWGYTTNFFLRQFISVVFLNNQKYNKSCLNTAVYLPY
jgi:hypothetical protein